MPQNKAASLTANPPQRGALKLAQTAEYLSLSPPTIHRLVRRGLLKPNRATRHLIFPLEELNRFLREGAAR